MNPTQYNTEFFHTAYNFLNQIKPNLSVQLQNDINAGNVGLVPQVISIKKEIVGGGTIDLLDGNTQRIDGICDFDKNRLETSRALIFDEIKLGYATDAAADKEGVLAYNTTLPVELKNATLLMKVNGREILRYPVKDLNNAGTATKTADFYAKMKALSAIVDAKEIQLQIKMAPGVSLSGAAHHYVDIAFSGVQTAVKG